jgi:tetratricopeptide (TPR) repeat protein
MTATTTTSTAGIQEAARHLAEGRPADAVRVLERLVADFPAYVTAYALLAKAYEANGRTEDALAAWHHAYFLMPGSPLVVRERTRLLRSAPRPESAGPGETPHESGGGEAAEALPPAPYETADEPAADEPAADEPAAEPEPAAGGSAIDEADDLDSLIHQLENAPRIRPDPDFRDEGVDEEEDEGGMVSETLARIYETQKQYAAAARAYDQLADEHPDRADEFESKAAEMRALANSSGSEA